MNISLNLNRPNNAAIDIPHGMLILSTLLSAKPKNILEIGIGTGFITKLLLEGITYNQVGELTTIDNFHDLGGNLPNSTLRELQGQSNIKIIAPVEEKDFVFRSEENQFDFLVSDGDHLHAGEWVDQIFKIIKPNSFMFFHDVNNPGYPNLMNYKTLSDKYNKPNFLFTKSSRADEECERGILMVLNLK